MREIFQLDWREKIVHREMARARTSLLKVASSIRQYYTFEENNAEWMRHAAEADGAAGCLESWMNAIREDSSNPEPSVPYKLRLLKNRLANAEKKLERYRQQRLSCQGSARVRIVLYNKFIDQRDRVEAIKKEISSFDAASRARRKKSKKINYTA